MVTQVSYVGPQGRGWSDVIMCDTDRRNALGHSMVSTLIDALCKALADGARGAVLRAEPGAPAWSAGFAIDELPETFDSSWSHPLKPLTDVIAGMPFPVVAAVGSGAWGGGCEIALRCDMVLAVGEAPFALTPAKLSVAYDTEALDALRRRVPAHVLSQMLLTAEPISASRLFQVGVVSQVFPDEHALDEGVASVMRAICARAPLSLAHAKAVLGNLSDDVIAARSAAAWGSQDYKEGRAAFQERRPAAFTGQ